MIRSGLIRLFSLGLLILTTSAFAQAPSITSISPQGWIPGQKVQVKIAGGNLTGTKELRVYSGADHRATGGPFSLSPDLPENGTKANEATFDVTINPATPNGIVGIRVVTDAGVSPLKFAVIDPLPPIPHNTANKTPQSAQLLTLPCAVEGHVDNLARHYFKFPVQTGQTLSFEVQARRIGTALDPILRLFDPSGRELAWSDDEPGLQGDCQFRHEFTEAGEYTLELSDIRYQGGGNHRFRLRIGDFFLTNSLYPMIGRNDQPVDTRLVGQSPPESSLGNVGITLEPFPPAPDGTHWILASPTRDQFRDQLEAANRTIFPPLGVTTTPQFLETEPNDTPEQANRVELGTSLNGRLEQPRDVDRFVFTAKKGQKFRFAAITRQAGSPSDLHLRLLKADGGQLAEAEDVGLEDATIDFTAPDDGDFTLVVRDLHERGGPEFVWHIRVTEIVPGFTLAASADAINIPAGSTNSLQVTAARKGYGGTIRVEARNLPEGVTSVPTYIGPGRNDAFLTLTASKEVAKGQISDIQIVGLADIGGQPFLAVADTLDALKAANHLLPWPPRNLISAIAVAVAPEPPVSIRIEPSELVLGQHLSAKVKLIVERQEGWDADIALAINPAQNGLPKGIALNVQPIKGGTNELELTLSADQNAALGEFTAAVNGTIKKDKETHVATIPGIAFRIQPPMSVSVEPPGGTLTKGGELKLKVTLQKNPALAAPIVLTVANLPNGVSAESITIPADQAEGELVLKAAADAENAEVKNVQIKAEATVGDKKLPGNSPDLTIKVE